MKKLLCDWQERPPKLFLSPRETFVSFLLMTSTPLLSNALMLLKKNKTAFLVCCIWTRTEQFFLGKHPIKPRIWTNGSQKQLEGKHEEQKDVNTRIYTDCITKSNEKLTRIGWFVEWEGGGSWLLSPQCHVYTSLELFMQSIELKVSRFHRSVHMTWRRQKERTCKANIAWTLLVSLEQKECNRCSSFERSSSEIDILVVSEQTSFIPSFCFSQLLLWRQLLGSKNNFVLTWNNVCFFHNFFYKWCSLHQQR